MIAMAHQIWHNTTGLFRSDRAGRSNVFARSMASSSGPLGRQEAEEWLDWFENQAVRTRLTRLANGCFEICLESADTSLPLNI